MGRCVASIAIVLAATRVHGQPAAEAEVLLQSGKKLLAAGKIAEACAKLDASQKLAPAVSTLLETATCREKNSQLATAWAMYMDVARQTTGLNDSRAKQQHRSAVDHAKKLQRRLSTLMIGVSSESQVDGLEIRRDNEIVDPAAWNQMLPVDGGTYTVTATAPGATGWSTTVTIGNTRDFKRVDVPKRAVAEHARVAKPAAPPKPAEPPEKWFCTESTFAAIGTCKLQREACEEFRRAVIAHIQDLGDCAAATRVVCFQAAGEAHCAPSEAICNKLRDVAAQSAAPTMCEEVRSPTKR